MRYGKWIGAALAAYGVYDMLLSTTAHADAFGGPSGFAIATSSTGGISALVAGEGTSFYIDLAAIVGGAYLFMKAA